MTVPDRLKVLWFLPTHGDGRHLGSVEGARAVDIDYLEQVAKAADRLGYYGVLLPTGRSCEDSWVVASALANSGLPPDRLELEVTESVFMKEGTCAVQVLEKILDLGVRLSLDDFGTGYSSLGYLSRTRFSSIKIDRSFVQGASKGQQEPIAIIRAVVALAQSLGMATTAEGVETEEEHKMVLDLGCTKIQGYYFGRPLPVAEARALASRNWGEAAAA